MLAPSPEAELWSKGCQWLGNDIIRNQEVDQPSVQGIEEARLWELTRRPRKYGFQAVVKPFFRLAAGKKEEELRAFVKEFVTRYAPLVIPQLRIALRHDRFQLEPTTLPAELPAFSASATRLFDRFSAPLSPSEYAQKKAAILTPEERKNLEVWGNPYVFHQYRFQIPLTNRIANTAEKEVILSALSRHFTSVSTAPVVIDALCLTVEAGTEQTIQCIERFPFTGQSTGAKDQIPYEPATQEDFRPRYQRYSP